MRGQDQEQSVSNTLGFVPLMGVRLEHQLLA